MTARDQRAQDGSADRARPAQNEDAHGSDALIRVSRSRRTRPRARVPDGEGEIVDLQGDLRSRQLALDDTGDLRLRLHESGARRGLGDQEITQPVAGRLAARQRMRLRRGYGAEA